MNMNFADIKADILYHWADLDEMPYCQDLITELAESAIPIYYSQIIKDWQEMPNEYTDSWKETTEVNQNDTIYRLMSIDLYNYYRDTYQQVYLEVAQEQEEAAEVNA
jgi:hypothetical protein